jgi:acetyl esterase/lipase
MTNALRFFGGLILFGIASLTTVPAPTRELWMASVFATEWGYWLAFAAILPLIPTRAATRLGRLGGVLSLGAIALFLVPVLRAQQLNSELPAAFEAAFGAERRQRGEFSEDPRQSPIVLPELIKPVSSRPVRFEERVFGRFDGQDLTLDIYRPGYEHGPVPALIVVHGGAWQSGDNSEGLALNGYLAARDYVVASINYRLAPRWRFPAARDDVLSAVAYLKVYASEFGIDPARIALLGRSAGGQLALLAAYTASEPSIRGVISIYGPTDLRFGYDHPAPKRLIDSRAVLESYLGGPPTTVDEAYFAASPVNFVTGSSPPTLLIHGLRDRMVAPEHSVQLAARLQQAGVKHLFVRLPWATHGCDRSFGGPCGQISTYAVERFLDHVMASPAPKPKPQGKLVRSRTGGSRSGKSGGAEEN